MYIIELITQLFRKKKNVENLYDPLIESSNNDKDSSSLEDCEHLFLPLDSSNTMFACKYCGLVVPKEKLKNKNIFENKSF